MSMLMIHRQDLSIPSPEISKHCWSGIFTGQATVNTNAKYHVDGEFIWQ